MEIETALEQLRGKALFIKTEPLDLDFSIPKEGFVVVSSEDKLTLKFHLSSSKKQLLFNLAQLTAYTCVSPVTICWNIKSLFSFYLKHVGKRLVVSNFYDLKFLENYLGIKKDPPVNFLEAKERLGKVLSHKDWEKASRVYINVYKSLISKTLPDIETIGLIKKRKQYYSCYEIEGQRNGRLKCSQLFANSFNPHSMSKEFKEDVKPPSLDHIFMHFDYNHMEPSVLQWLSKDTVLFDMFSKGDLYESVWKKLTTLDATPVTRKKCKKLFLPVIYGQGIESIAERNEIDLDLAKKLRERIYTCFPMAMGWLIEGQKISGNWAVDKMGRHRYFDEKEKYKIRNFLVQSPASLFCLSKLNELNEGVGDLAHVGSYTHDGYILYVRKKDVSQLNFVGKKILESENKLFPGLKLKVSCEVGYNLNFMKKI